MSIVVRTANPADGEAVVQVMSQAFHRPPGTDKYNRDQSAFQREPENYCVLEQNGHILGAFHVARHRIQIGSCIITKADIGEVSIHPDHQGKSLGSHMMQEAVSWMKQAGFHLSRLGGYNRFYQRFGWTPFVRGFIEFPLSGLTSRGGHTDPEEMLRPQHPDHIRPYHPKQDADACAHLYAIFNHNRTGAPPPDTKSFPNSGPLHPWHLVYESQGKVQAYLFASATDADHNRFNTRVSFHDAAVDPADPTPFGHLLRHTLLEAHRYGTTTVSARLPLDPALHAIYRDYSLGFIATIWQTTESGNMLQILHLQALIDTLLPEFQTRLQNAIHPAPECNIRFHVNNQTATLNLQNGPQRDLDLPQDLFCHLLLGLQSVAQIAPRLPQKPPPEILRLLDILFPPQPTATGIWG